MREDTKNFLYASAYLLLFGTLLYWAITELQQKPLGTQTWQQDGVKIIDTNTLNYWVAILLGITLLFCLIRVIHFTKKMVQTKEEANHEKT